MRFIQRLFGKKRSAMTRADVLKDLGFKVIDLRTKEDRQIEEEAYAGRSLGPEIDLLVDELVKIGINDGNFLSMQPGGKFNEDCRHIRTREIGKKLDEMGGISLMKKVAYRISARLGTGLGSNLERAWRNIGQWQP